MKITLLIIALFISLSISAQIKIDETSYQYYYQEVFEVEGSQEQLKEKAHAWLMKNYKDSSKVVTMNPDSNFIGKGVFDGKYEDQIGMEWAGVFHFTLEISVKENSYQLNIFDIYPEVEIDGLLTVYPFCFGMIAPIEDDEVFRTIHIELMEKYLTFGKSMNIKYMLKPANTARVRKKQT